MSEPVDTTIATAPLPAAKKPEGGFQPYVPDDKRMPEFTLSAVVLGSILGIIFAASSLYLVLKVGMTVSASIPVSVLAITLFRAFSKSLGFRQATILENNVVQTAGSAGESIAFGVGVTMPALLLLGYAMDLPRVMVVAILGGLLGILAMIPLRRAFIVKLHGKPGEPGTLLFPEGTACAQVLISGEKGGTTGKTVFIGFGIAFLHKFLTEGMNVLVGTFKWPLTFINRSAVFANEFASELLGVGYIIGARTSAIMMSGAILGYLVIIPLISYVGDYVDDKPVPPGGKLISEMSTREIRDNYLLFMGAGCVATAGIISMFRTMPMIIRSIRSGLQSVTGGGSVEEAEHAVRRTENDMSMKTVLFGSLGLMVLLTLFLTADVGLGSAIAGGALVVLFGFLFVTVSSRLTGEIGSSSNPISGMTVATLTLTCLIFLALGWESSTMRVLALSIAAVVCVASSNGGTTAQSLKTGFLVGGTPRYNQWAILIGALTSALVIGGTLLAFNAAGTVYSQKPENLPSITLTPEERTMLPAKETYKGEEYLVWDTHRDTFAPRPGYTPRPELAAARPGRYLVDPSTGKVRWLVDPGIMGKLEETDEGVKVKRDFDAPKTQVMGIIITGVLERKLNWGLVLIGSLIAVMLELCGVSSLAFAVGVYVPIQFSTPIFIGGLVRWAVDAYMARTSAAAIAEATTAEERAQAEIDAIRKSETSPGVLLASGYIAGGSLAGMLLAFTNFSDQLPKTLTAWQYREETVASALAFSAVAEETARHELHLPASGDLSDSLKEKVKAYIGEMEELNSDELARLAPVPKGTKVLLPKRETYVAAADTTLGAVAKEKLGDADKAVALMKLNEQELIPFIVLKKGTKLRMPDYSIAEVEEDTTLGKFAEKKLGSSDEAQSLYERNKKVLKLPEKSPEGIVRLEPADQVLAGTTLKIPQHDWPAELAFALLVLFLLAVGAGLLLKAPSDEPSPPSSGESLSPTNGPVQT
jgi:putative OPT family oligopeptide transporter